ncbi:MAG: hypothetical protein JW956_05065, partial [Calditrichaceae bacterium]|nr:hypothetical protein [Calditrichaceae bacterium]
MFIRYLLLFILFILLFRIIKTALIGSRKNNTVKGRPKDEQSVQQKHKDKIEDADFEEIE